MELATGQLISDQYEILQPIGRGGFGVVYLARDRKLDREVALKILINDADLISSDFLARFQREIRLCRQLEHPNIVRLYDYGDMGGCPYMVMEFVRGVEVADHLLKYGAMNFAQAQRIMLQLLDGLVTAHNLRIVHRDLKPNNMMMTEVGMRSDFIKILDFGIAKAVRDAERDTKVTFQTQNQLLGTPSYMSPEQLRQEPVGPPADIYAAGLIFIELLTGQALLEGTMVEVVARHIDPRDHVLPPEAAQSPFADFIRKAVAKNAADRFVDSRQMYQALEAIQVEEGLGYVSTGTGPQPAVGRSGAVTPHPVDPNRINTGQVDPASTGPDPKRPTAHLLSAPANVVSQTSDIGEVGKKSSLTMILVAMIALVLIGGAILGFMLMSGDKTDAEGDKTAEGSADPGAEGAEGAEAGADMIAAGTGPELGTPEANAAGNGTPETNAAAEKGTLEKGTPETNATAEKGTPETNAAAEKGTPEKGTPEKGTPETNASAEKGTPETNEGTSDGGKGDAEGGKGEDAKSARKERPDRDNKERIERVGKKLISVKFASDPPGAKVNAGGKTCKTPCQLKFKKGARPKATIAKRGYQSKTVRVDGTRNSKVDVKLYRGL